MLREQYENTINKYYKNYDFKIIGDFFKGKKIAVLGFGVSNRPLVKLLSSFEADITVFEKKDEQSIGEYVSEYKKIGVKFITGENNLLELNEFNIIFRSPGMRPDLPQINKEVLNGALLISEMEMFFDLCPAKIIAVTGSDGKTTTTSLIYEMLKESGETVWLGGNIGTPLINKIREIKKEHIVVLELSSFQLMTLRKSPKVALVTNISPNHLDWHKGMDEYIEAKSNIIKNQNEENILILNNDNKISKALSNEAKSQVYFFSRKEKDINGIYVEDEKIVINNYGEKTILIEKNKIKLPGEHNVENFMAAAMAVYNIAKIEAIKKVAVEFTGVEHRIEYVKNVEEVAFYNDSIGTSPTRTMASLNAFNKKVILIAGGYDKKISYEPLGEVLDKKVKVLILMGNTAKKIEDAYMSYIRSNLKEPIPIVHVENMEDAVGEAQLLSKPNDIVLLSPASASFDMYPNFAKRGEHFKQIVNRI